MNCRCHECTEITNQKQVRVYISDHLILIKNDIPNWTAYFKCPDTELLWMSHYPHSERHGGGPKHLKRIESID